MVTRILAPASPAFTLVPTLPDGKALYGQFNGGAIPVANFSPSQAAAGITLKKDQHNYFSCTIGGPLSLATPNIGTVRAWSYEFTGTEPPFNGKFFISQGELAMNPSFVTLNTLTSFDVGRRYYFMTAQDLLFRCGQGLSVPGSCGDGICQAGETVQSCVSDCNVCGDGIVAGSEQCDDGNQVDGETDGCSNACIRQLGWGCVGSPSVCSLLVPNLPIHTAAGSESSSSTASSLDSIASSSLASSAASSAVSVASSTPPSSTSSAGSSAASSIAISSVSSLSSVASSAQASSIAASSVSSIQSSVAVSSVSSQSSVASSTSPVFKNGCETSRIAGVKFMKLPIEGYPETYNLGGLQERWFWASGAESAWYFILPSGTVHASRSGSMRDITNDVKTVAATFRQAFWIDLQKVYNWETECSDILAQSSASSATTGIPPCGAGGLTTLGFWTSNNFNYGGMQEKWFYSNGKRYFILPSGSVHEWKSNTKDLSSDVENVVVRFPMEFYNNLSNLENWALKCRVHKVTCIDPFPSINSRKREYVEYIVEPSLVTQKLYDTCYAGSILAEQYCPGSGTIRDLEPKLIDCKESGMQCIDGACVY